MQPPVLQIGPIRAEQPTVLAPMAGVTDRDFRLIVKRIGGGGFAAGTCIAAAAMAPDPEAPRPHPPATAEHPAS